MIGMDFISFLILLVISVVVSGILHYGLNYYVTPGFWSFCSKVAVGWAGAWIGSPPFGHWAADLHYGDNSFIPALLCRGCFLLFSLCFCLMARATPSY